MAKENNFPENQTWGTWEELLLACAVNRYGTESWNSVAVEIQKRSSTLHRLTSHACKQKYHDLERRFTPKNAVSETRNDENSPENTTVPWLEELRKLRVAELKREVERYDLSIVSLQLKVKRLTEEREQSLREDEETEKSDLERSLEKDGKGEKSSDAGPEDPTGKPVVGEESDRENRSVNESNSTDPKGESPGTGTEVAEEKPEPVEPNCEKTNQIGETAKPIGEDSCNGSCGSVAKESAASLDGKLERVNPNRESGGSPELFEWVGESKGGGEREEETKESSDVQSSASLSRRKKGQEPDEPDAEDQSPAIKRVSVESQPLADFLEILRSHKCGSIFERRLESQETPNYKNLIRQHMDLETIGIRLQEGWYSGTNSKFFRDLLLLDSNAVTFFGKESSEFTAAVELHRLISKEMASNITSKPNPSPKEQSLAVPQGSMTLKLDPEPPQSRSIALKPKISVPMIVCRKRSSITAKASSSSSGPEKKGHQTVAILMDEKPVLDWKQRENSSDKAEEQRVTKKRTRERFTSVRASNSNRNGKSRANTKPRKNSDANDVDFSIKGGSNNENNLESKAEKEKQKNANANAKKQSAAKFLNRMKRSSSSSNGPLLETLKNSAMSSSDHGKGEESEQKKNGNGSGNGKGDTRKGSSGKRGKERGSPAKRSVGRPPKRGAAAAPPPLPSAPPPKRIREADETEAVASRHAKKRSRK